MRVERTVLLRLWVYLRPYWRLELVTFAVMLCTAALALALPVAVRYLIDDLIPRLAQASGQVAVWPVVLFGGALIGIYFLNVLFSWLRDFLAARISAGIVRDMRSALFYHLERVSLRFHQKNSVGEIMSRVLSDVDRVEDLLTNVLLAVLADILLLLVILIYLLHVNWILALIALIPLPVTVLLSNRFGRRLHNITREYQQTLARISGRLQEVLSSLTTVLAFGQEKRERKRFDGELNSLSGWIVKSSVTNSLAVNLVHFVNMVGPIVVLAWGTYLVAGGSIKLGALMAFYILLTYLYQPVQDLASLNVHLQAAMASVHRIFEYLDLKPAVVEDPQPVTSARIVGVIELEDVQFQFEPNGFKLDIPRLVIRPGETVAVVGPSGSGKTTLINLILRFFDVQRGRITIDNIDIRRLRLDDLRRRIGLVEQEPVLFRATVCDNIAYADASASAEAVEEAARVANIHEFITGLEHGYQTEIGERGVTLSGGERQRICLARALLKNPPILLLDEATSALDSRSEHLIQEALQNVLVDKTALIVAHRLATVKHARCILVMDNGHITATGSHEQLLSSSAMYRDLATKQMISIH